jgi:hypothetical protein
MDGGLALFYLGFLVVGGTLLVGYALRKKPDDE